VVKLGKVRIGQFMAGLTRSGKIRLGQNRISDVSLG